MTSNLKDKARVSVRWTLIKTLANTILQPFYRIFLGLLLLPSEFAYIAVITLIVSFAEKLNNVGIGEAVIQRDNINRKDLSSLFFFNLLITIVVTLVVYFSSELIANYYSMNELTSLIKILTLIIFINGATSLFKFYLHKEFFFKETSIIQIVKILIEITLSICLIIFGYGIWGFTLGVVISNLIHGLLISIVVFRKTNFRISLFMSFKNIRRFLDFGIFVGTKKMVTFFSHRIDEIIIGGVLSPDVLGSYFFAKNILFQLQSLITVSFGQVLLPTFSRLKNDINSLKRYYFKILSLVSFIGFPIFIGVILTADFFVPAIFGYEWTSSIIVFKTLSLPILAELLVAGIATSLLYSQNKSLLVLKIDLIVVFVYVLSLMFFKNEDLITIILIYSSYIIIKFLVTQYFLNKILSINLVNYYKTLKGTIISSILMALMVLLFLEIGVFKGQLSNVLILIFSIVLGLIVYICSSLLLNMKQSNEFKSFIISMIKR